MVQVVDMFFLVSCGRENTATWFLYLEVGGGRKSRHLSAIPDSNPGDLPWFGFGRNPSYATHGACIAGA